MATKTIWDIFAEIRLTPIPENVVQAAINQLRKDLRLEVQDNINEKQMFELVDSCFQYVRQRRRWVSADYTFIDMPERK